MRLLISIAVLLSFYTSAYSQKNNYFLITYSGDSVVADQSIKLRSPLFKSPFFEVDDVERIDEELVWVYQNERGFFKKFGDSYNNEFYERTLEGKYIEGYAREVTTYSQPAPGMGYSGGTFNTSKIDYYTYDGVTLKKMTLKNLKLDLQDNPYSMESLQKVKKLNILSGFLYAAGAALVVGGISGMVNDQGETPSSPSGMAISPLLIAGAVTLNIPWFLRSGKVKNMKEAIHFYNMDRN